MHLLIYFCLPTLILGLSVKNKRLVQNTYVIEFDLPSHTNTTHSLLQRRTQFYNHLDFHNIGHTVRHEYEYMNAVSVSFHTAAGAAHYFRQGRHIKRLWPVSSISKPTVVNNRNNSHIPFLFDMYESTGIHRVRKELGYDGKGIKVGIIDTGVDYMHPALGGCFGLGCRVAYGFDLVGDAYSGHNFPRPDKDPRDTCNGHGTHVAVGIIGAKDIAMNFTGIAPEVTFGAYRIFGCFGTTTDDVIMMAIEKAYKDGMDVVNLSIGDMGWPESPVAVMADAIASRGISVCAAAGNEGEKGFFKTGVPSLGKHVISVASVDNTKKLAYAVQVEDVFIAYSREEQSSMNLTSTEMVATSNVFLQPHDGCSPLSDLTGKVALIARGSCEFTVKLINAQNAGATAVLFYNNAQDTIVPTILDDRAHIPYAGISLEDGQTLFNLTQRSPGTTVSFPKDQVLISVKGAKSVSSFSSWGLGPDLSIKPDISAPGGDIFSTYPLALGGYTTMSGTSMASPYVAGVIALIHQSRGGGRSIDIETLRTLLINNAKPYTMQSSTSYESIARQGGGLIDAYQSLKATHLVFPPQIQLDDKTEHISQNQYTFTIENLGDTQAEYTLSHVSAIAAQGYAANPLAENVFPLKTPILHTHHETEAVVQLPATPIVVDARTSTLVTVQINPPLLASSLPPTIYSGFIAVASTNTTDPPMHIPYAGLTSKLSMLPVLNINKTTPFISANTTDSQSPMLVAIQLIESSPLIVALVVDARNTTNIHGAIPGGMLTFVGRNDMSNPLDVYTLRWYGSVMTAPVLGSLSSKPEYQTPRVFQLDPGFYKLKIMALRTFGHPEKEADYDTWISPDILLK
ncbi:peptidase S8/S53 domain-containing protein [Spinellus fusiger]|nr:peptidase S8/S53 domain-containing protein [Spinellus fusiger]